MEKRQTGIWGDEDHWYYSPTAVAIKWSILAAIVTFVLVFFVGGYYHAQRRMKDGLPPMAYHRWFIPRRQLARFQPNPWQPPNQFSFYHAQENGYSMHPVPPPAYNPHLAPPPVYQPPEGASKVAPSQYPESLPARPDGSTGLRPQDLTSPAQAPGPSVPQDAQPNTNPFR